MTVNKAALRAPSGLIKLLCLAICIIVVILARVGFENNVGRETDYLHQDHRWLLITTIAGYTLILSVMVVTYLWGSSIPNKMEFLFMFAGCILFLASGALTIDRYDDAARSSTKDTGLALGSLMVINGILMFADSVLIGKTLKH